MPRRRQSAPIMGAMTVRYTQAWDSYRPARGFPD